MYKRLDVFGLAGCSAEPDANRAWSAERSPGTADLPVGPLDDGPVPCQVRSVFIGCWLVPKDKFVHINREFDRRLATLMGSDSATASG